ncbi:MAG: nucleotidyl transferase AbiEii/AbiGii toxin family protein [Candidatus Omnitrophica bacterium]|nr:nucleotidyl transferase AbiEii/AbiGii toxin family protein [Candidatus Omnitrophota bacterium]
MESKVRGAQRAVLRVFSRQAGDFALAGGTALELYYLHHRFSADLDFFSPRYGLSEIERLVSAFEKGLRQKMRLESESEAGGRARVRVYSMPVKGSPRPLKIDFVEDVLVKKPEIRKADGVRVYSPENIYFMKIAAISGIRPMVDEVGREVMEGRGQARDVFDVHLLSKCFEPLRLFLKAVPAPWQKGIVHWYRTFSRQELKLALMDLDIYDAKFDSGEMIRYLEDEVRQFAKAVLEA